MSLCNWLQTSRLRTARSVLVALQLASGCVIVIVSFIVAVRENQPLARRETDEGEFANMNKRAAYTGRFQTLHKRRRRPLVTRSLRHDAALLDDLQLRQVQASCDWSARHWPFVWLVQFTLRPPHIATLRTICDAACSGCRKPSVSDGARREPMSRWLVRSGGDDRSRVRNMSHDDRGPSKVLVRF